MDEISRLEKPNVPTLTPESRLGQLDRREFIRMSVVLGGLIASEHIGMKLTNEQFAALVRKSYDSQTQKLLIPPSKIRSSINWNIISSEPLLDRTNISQLLVDLVYPPVQDKLRNIKFTDPADPTRPIYLVLGDHGTVVSVNFHPIQFETDLPIEQIAIDSIGGPFWHINWAGGPAQVDDLNYVRDKIKEALSQQSSEEMIGVDDGIKQDTGNRFATDYTKLEINSGAILGAVLRGWIPIDNLAQQQKPKIISTDINTKATNSVKTLKEIRLNYEELNEDYESFKSAILLGDMSVASYAIYRLLDKVTKKKLINEESEPVPKKKKTNITRREFLRLFAAASGITSLIQFARSLFYTGDLQFKAMKNFQNTPFPSEDKPEGYRGVVEYLLSDKAVDVPEFSIDDLLRNLISTYKTKVLHKQVSEGRADYTVWGKDHALQIGLLDLTPDQILDYIRQFKSKYGKFLQDNFDVDNPMDQVWTATEYSYDWKKEEIRLPGVNEKKTHSRPEINNIKLYVFPELHRVFSDIGSSK